MPEVKAVEFAVFRERGKVAAQIFRMQKAGNVLRITA